jgi:trk system potassium uptake protein TrkA
MKKFVVIGLGNFGLSLSAHLTTFGHEVIGVDSNMSKVEQNKDIITSTICIDVCDIHSLKMLPLAEADAVFVTIGEDFGSSVMVTALLKQLKATNIYSRAINELHRTVLASIGVKNIINPEEDSALRIATAIQYAGVVDSFKVDSTHSVVELAVSELYWGRTYAEVKLYERYGLKIIGVKRPVKSFSIIGKAEVNYEIVNFENPDFTFSEGDIFVLFGKVSALSKMG